MLRKVALRQGVLSKGISQSRFAEAVVVHRKHPQPAVSTHEYGKRSYGRSSSGNRNKGFEGDSWHGSAAVIVAGVVASSFALSESSLEATTDTGVFFDDDSHKWSSYVRGNNGKIIRLKDCDTQKQAQRDYDWITARAKVPHPDALSAKTEDEKERVKSIVLMDMFHSDASKTSRERKKSFFQIVASVVSDDDVPVLWRLARGIHDLTDEYFESREEQEQFLVDAIAIANKALREQPQHPQAVTWLRLATLRLLQLQISIRTTRTKEYAVPAEEKAALSSEILQLQKELHALQKELALE